MTGGKELLWLIGAPCPHERRQNLPHLGKPENEERKEACRQAEAGADVSNAESLDLEALPPRTETCSPAGSSSERPASSRACVTDHLHSLLDKQFSSVPRASTQVGYCSARSGYSSPVCAHRGAPPRATDCGARRAKSTTPEMQAPDALMHCWTSRTNTSESDLLKCSPRSWTPGPNPRRPFSAGTRRQSTRILQSRNRPVSSPGDGSQSRPRRVTTPVTLGGKAPSATSQQRKSSCGNGRSPIASGCSSPASVRHDASSAVERGHAQHQGGETRINRAPPRTRTSASPGLREVLCLEDDPGTPGGAKPKDLWIVHAEARKDQMRERCRLLKKMKEHRMPFNEWYNREKQCSKEQSNQKKEAGGENQDDAARGDARMSTVSQVLSDLFKRKQEEASVVQIRRDNVASACSATINSRTFGRKLRFSAAYSNAKRRQSNQAYKARESVQTSEPPSPRIKGTTRHLNSM